MVPPQALDRTERVVSDPVSAAFGLTPVDGKAMWDTTPPRMPFTGCSGTHGVAARLVAP